MEQSKKRFLKNMVGFSLNTWIGFAIGLIASPIATRLFSVDEMGKLNMFSLYASLFAATAYLGLDQAYVRFFREPPAGSTSKGLFTFCASSSLTFGLVAALIALPFWRGVSAQVATQPDMVVYLCLVVYSLCLIAFRYLSLSYRMEQNARLYTIQGVMQVLLTKIVYLTIAFRSAQAKLSIVMLTLLMAAFTLAFAFVQRRRVDRHFLTQVNAPFLKEVGAYAAPLIPLAIMSWLNNSVSVLVLRNLMSVAAVGVYTSGLVLASTINLIQTGFNTYWAPYVYENYQRNDQRRFFTVHRLMACLLTGFGLTMTLLQAPVYLLLGPAFRGSAVYFPFLFLTPISYCLSETTGMGIGIAKKSYWNTLIFMISALVSLGLSYLLIPLWQDAGAAMAAAGGAMVALGIRTLVGERYYKAIASYRYLGYSLGLMLLAAVANYALSANAVVKYIALAAIYALALYLFRREIATLLTTARQLLQGGADALKRKAVRPTDEGDPS